MDMPKANDGKEIRIKIGDDIYDRYPIQTGTVMPNENLIKIIINAISKYRQDGDMIVIAESVVAISQGRAYIFDEIKASPLATFLSRFVTKVPWGIGLGRPETMHLAIIEVGVARILFATFVAAITRPLGIRGMFYRVAGRKAALIDGPCSYTMPPFNKYATLGPKDPIKTAKEYTNKIGCETMIVDANDMGTACIGWASRDLKKLGEELTRDNPMGQGSQGTPVLLVRKI